MKIVRSCPTIGDFEKRSKLLLSKILSDPVLPWGILKKDLNFQNLGFFGSGGQTWGPILILSLYHLTCVTFHFINFHVSPHHHTCITFHSINFHISPYHLTCITLLPITLSPFILSTFTDHLITPGLTSRSKVSLNLKI